MDSARPSPPTPTASGTGVPLAEAPDETALAEAPSETALEIAEAPPGVLARLGRMLPGVDAVVRAAYRTAGLSAIAVAVILYAVWDAFSARMVVSDLVVLGIVLILPALAIALAGWTLADVARLPGQIRDAALQAARREPVAAKKGSRIGRMARSLWAARGLALLTRGGWLKAAGALRFVRLASLPFALGLVLFVALNGVVILGGLFALLTLVL